MAKKKTKLVAKTKTDFIKILKDSVAEKVALTNDQTKLIYDTFIQIVMDTVEKEKRMNLNGLGTFKVVKRKARTGRNPPPLPGSPHTTPMGAPPR